MTDEHKDKNQDEKKSELEILQEKCDQYLAGWQRAKADYSNLQKETERKREEMAKFANAAIMAEMLPIYDNFKAAFGHTPESDDKEWQKWQEGIGHIKKQMQDFIAKFGIEEIQTIGEKFNPQLHESVGEEESDDFESGTIIKETKPGYTLHGELLTPAKVIVAK